MALDYGFRVSLPGFNVLSCQEKDLVITSKSVCFKIVEFGEIGFQFSGGYATVQIAHTTPLPFTVIAYYYSNAVEAWRAISNISFDSSNIYFEISDSDTVTNPVIRYFVLYG